MERPRSMLATDAIAATVHLLAPSPSVACYGDLGQQRAWVERVFLERYLGAKVSAGEALHLGDNTIGAAPYDVKVLELRSATLAEVLQAHLKVSVDALPLAAGNAVIVNITKVRVTFSIHPDAAN